MGSPASTRSPSWTSHSASTPSYPAETLTSSRRLRTRPSGVPAGRWVPSATSAGLTVPRTGATTTRQPRKLPRSTTSGLQQLPRPVEVGGAGDGEDLDVAALPLALGETGQRAGGRQLDRGGDAEVAQGGQARVEADRAGDLADQTGERLGAGVHRLAVGVGQQLPAGTGRPQAADQALELLARRAHVRGVEGAGHRQRDHAGLAGRVGLE